MKVIHSGLSEEMTRKVGHLPLGTPALLYSWVDGPDEGAEHLLVQEGYTRSLCQKPTTLGPGAMLLKITRSPSRLV
jgi:hypothetical protein